MSLNYRPVPTCHAGRRSRSFTVNWDGPVGPLGVPGAGGAVSEGGPAGPGCGSGSELLRRLGGPAAESLGGPVGRGGGPGVWLGGRELIRVLLE